MRYPAFPRGSRGRVLPSAVSVTPVTCPECPFGEKPRAVHPCLLHLCVNTDGSLSSWWTQYWAEWRAEVWESSLCSSTSTPASGWGGLGDAFVQCGSRTTVLGPSSVATSFKGA